MNLVAVGGTPPYTFTVVAGAGTTIPATISGSSLTVDATTLDPGFYQVEVAMADIVGNTTTTTIPVEVVVSTTYGILNQDIAFEPTTFPQSLSIPLATVGATGTVTWSLLANYTTLPTASISGATLSFTATTFGSWSVGLRAIDALGNNATQLIEVSVVTGVVTRLVDGQVEIDVTAEQGALGTQSFSIAVIDSTGTAAAENTFTYNVEEQIAAVDIAEAAIDHVWTLGDTTEVVYPVTGNLSGFSLAPASPIIAPNGLTVTVDPVAGALIVAGPPTSFETTEVDASLILMRNATEVATVTRTYALVSTAGDGSFQVNTRPYITGDLVGLNPLRPFFNAPTYIRPQLDTLQLQAGQSLPPGLSLDSVSGQIYGTVVGGGVPTSVLQYTTPAGTVDGGSFTIHWDILVSEFVLIDQGGTGEIQSPFTASISSSSAAPLTSVALHYGELPQGVAVGLDSAGANIVFSGTPLEAGYFDIWLQATNATGQVGYCYKRLVIDYIAPLVILTDFVPVFVTNQSYSTTLAGFGGVQPYSWTVTAGTLPAGVTLSAASGVLSGTPTASTYSQQVTFTLTDERGVTSSTILALQINNSLTITTLVLPLITPGQPYQYQLLAQGGVSPYTWALQTGSPALPGGFTLASSGLLSGSTSLVNYNQNVVIAVTDSASTSVSSTFNLLIGAQSGLIIDIEGIGPLVRGQYYQGLLAVEGPGVAPYVWSVAPTTPNPLPAGITLTATVANQGATATIAGITTSDLLNYSVQIQAVDTNGNLASVFLLLNTYSSLAITTQSLPQGTVLGTYSVQMQAQGVNPPFSWSITQGSAPNGETMTTGGLLSGTPTVAGTFTFTVKVVDALGDYATAAFTEVTKQSTLAITTTSLPTCYAGISYGPQLNATGGTPNYIWSISPASASGLPPGLSLSNSGVISGTTYAVGFQKSITFRVTDAITVYREWTQQFSVVSRLQLIAGPDYIQGTSFNSLGMTGNGDQLSINPRPNLSFYVVATGCISTVASGITCGVAQGFSYSVDSLANGIAYIKLTGPFLNGSQGDNNFFFTINDGGVLQSATFTYRVYPEQSLSIVPAAGESFPLYYLN